jgi:hypothetical protein
VRSVVTLPLAVSYWPGTQLVHAMHAVAEFPSSSQVPVAQDCLGAVPPAQYVPAGHDEQVAGEVAVPAVICSVPAWHTSAGKHCDRFGWGVNVPLAQTAHCRFALAVPATLT